MSLENLAKEFATFHHGSIDQRRKYTNEPYIVHPESVVNIVKSVPHTESMVCAAWLHDTVEDTNATLSDVEDVFGKEIASLVEMLTDVSRLEDGNRARRREIDRLHTAQASPAAKTIKLADLIDNSRSIVAFDPGFARVYLPEKELLLGVLTEGDKALWKIANEILVDGMAKLRLRER